jgi:hypothetical protein
MPRYANYERPQTRSQRERAAWEDPATLLGLARVTGDAINDAERLEFDEMKFAAQEQQRAATEERLTERLAIDQMKAHDDQQESLHATGAFSHLLELDPAQPDYRKRVTGVIARYPRAVLNKDVAQLLEKRNQTHDAFIGSLRDSFGLPAEVDPRQYTSTDEETGIVSFDFDLLDQVGKRSAISKSAETAEILAERVKALQAQNIAEGATRATLTDKGTTVQMGGPDESAKREAALTKDELAEARTRRMKALSLRYPTRGYHVDKTAEAAAQKELEDANLQYDAVYKRRFGRSPADDDSGEETAPETAPKPAASAPAPKAGAAKALDKATAMKFLQDAKGDKAKARELARSAGFSF